MYLLDVFEKSSHLLKRHECHVFLVCDTVDGRNPANQFISWVTPLFIYKVYTSQVVVSDFFHQQYPAYMKFSQLLGGQNQDMSDPLEGNRGLIPVALFTCSHCCPDAPWDERYIYLHVWLKFMVNVDKYSIHGAIWVGLFVSIFFFEA